MRALITKCNKFESKDTQHSDLLSNEQKNERELTSFQYQDIILVQVTVEEGDTRKSAVDLARRVKVLSERFGSDYSPVVVMPFVHLSRHIADIKLADSLIDISIEKMTERGLKVDKISFGTHKAELIETPGDPGETSWFEV